MAKLVVFRGDAVEREMHLAEHTVRIGRDDGNEIVLNDKSVSRFHAEVRLEAGTYFIVDLKSRNGVWLNGQQIKKKATLALGVPVTLGAYELALEDDVVTGEFDAGAAVPQQTVASASVDKVGKPSRSATRVLAPPSSASTAKSRRLVWSGAAALLLIGGVTFAVMLYRGRPATTVTPIDPVSVSVPSTVPPAEDPSQEVIAREAELKRQADEAAAAAQMQKSAQVVAKTEVPAAEIETPGIPRRANEAWADYTARVKRIQTSFQEGNRSLEKQEFGAAIARFQSVDRDQKGYQGVDTIIRETMDKQTRALVEALDGGRKNEQAERWSDALKWFERALVVDPASATARERAAALKERLGLAAFDDAEVLRKRGESAKAIQSYKQVVDLLPRGHEKNRQAQRYLETLKP